MFSQDKNELFLTYQMKNKIERESSIEILRRNGTPPLRDTL